MAQANEYQQDTNKSKYVSGAHMLNVSGPFKIPPSDYDLGDYRFWFLYLDNQESENSALIFELTLFAL